MRKRHQKQILDLLKTLDEAHAEIERLLSAGQMELAVQWLLNCQDGAAHVARFIEQLEGEETRTVTLLEEYGELLYRVGVEISESEAGQSEERASLVQRLQKQLAEMENSARNDLKADKIEIAFLPYKASMWDSMESVWRAANDDPDCDAYVISLPYYDRRPDGTLGQMHCEGDQYPEDVPIIDWQKYNLEERHPDVIVIHSPYDDNNYVKSVHPYFYSQRLKEFTDLLVYIPYFVCVDDVPEHFCTCTGVLYADKVIVQSNKVRDTYIRVFREIEKKNNRPGGFGKLEEKFIALGSPKFDKVIHTKCENCKIPDEWNRLIEKPDGTRKKVILYNTSVSALLKGNEKVLAKLRYTFERFRNRDDAVLWWRPHPMSEATCQSMRPQLHSDYLEIVAKYKRQGFGIYDDTADLHRAIAWSDAYYGDESSIVPLYQVTGKPVMLGNILQQQDQGEFRFLPAYLYAGETDIWFSIRQINALFKMNKNTWESRFVGSFPGEVECITRFNAMLYQTPVENKGVIYFPPFYAKEIAAYSVVDDTFTKFSYKKSGDEEAYHSDFCGAVAYGDYVYFTPYLYPAIVRLDPATGEMDYYSDWIEPLEKRIGDVQDVFFLRPVVVGKSIWLAACGANAVVEFNMETQRSTVNEAGKKGYRYGGICFDGENYWLSPRFFTTTPVVKWNPKMGIIKEFTEIYLDDTEPHGFYPIVYGGGFVWLFPSFSRHPYKIDVHTNIVSIADEFEFDLSDDKNAQSSKECCRYKALTIIDDSIFAYVGSVETIIEYNFVTKERKYKMGRYLAETMAQIKPLLAGAFLTGTGQMKSVYDCCYYEDDVIGLADFLNHLTSETDMDKMGELMNKRMAIAKEINVHVNGTAGQMIYDFIRKAMLG